MRGFRRLRLLFYFAACVYFLLVAGCPITPGRSARHRSDTVSQRKSARLKQGTLCSPLLVESGKVYFLQPDFTLTVLSLETGEVLRRDTGPRQWDDFGNAVVTEWLKAGRFAVADGRPGLFFVDLEAGTISTMSSLLTGRLDDTQPLPVGDAILFLSNGSPHSFDGTTGRVTKLNHLSLRFFDVMDGKGYGLSLGMGDYGYLYCFDAHTGEILWKRSNGGDGKWSAFACGDKTVTAFEVDSFSPSDRSLPVIALSTFSEDGSLIAAGTPDIADFGGRWPSFITSFSFRGRGFNFMRPAVRDDDKWIRLERSGLEIRPERVEPGKSFQRNVRLRNQVKVVSLADGGSAGIGTVWDAPDGTAGLVERTVVFRQGAEGRGWQGTLPGTDSTPPNAKVRSRGGPYSCRATDDRLLIATPDGRVECLDLDTGRSLWLYSFPGFDRRRWGEVSFLRFADARGEDWLSGYYTDVRTAYQKSLAPGKLPCFAVDGDPAPPSARIAVDPAPPPFPKAYAAPFFLAGLLSLTVWLLVRDLRSNGRRRCERAKRRTPAAFLPIIVAYAFLARYSLLGDFLMCILLLTAAGRWIYFSRKVKMFTKPYAGFPRRKR